MQAMADGKRTYNKTFKDAWILQFLCTKHGVEVQCLICKKGIICKKSNVKRHYETQHEVKYGQYTGKDRYDLIADLISKMEVYIPPNQKATMDWNDFICALMPKHASEAIRAPCLPANRVTVPAESPVIDSINVSSTVGATIPTSGTSAVPIKRARVDDTNTMFPKVSKELSSQQTDEFEIFGIHVASQLRLLSLEQSIIAQEQIQSVLTRCRLQDLRGTSE